VNQFDLEATWTIIVSSTQLLDAPPSINLRERLREVDLVDKVVIAVTGGLRLVRGFVGGRRGRDGSGLWLLAAFLAPIAAPLATLSLTACIVLWVAGLEVGALFLVLLHAFPLDAPPVARTPVCVMAIRGHIAIRFAVSWRCCCVAIRSRSVQRLAHKHNGQQHGTGHRLHQRQSAGWVKGSEHT